MTTQTPIVRVFFSRTKLAFLELSDEEQTEFMVRDRSNLDALGMTAITMVDCRDTDGEWDHIGVEGWPSMAAVEERERFETEELEISRYVECEVHLGIEESFEEYGTSH